MEKTNSQVHTAYKNSGMTPEQFAGALGVSITTLRAWFRPETNRAYRHAPRMAAKLAQTIPERQVPAD